MKKINCDLLVVGGGGGGLAAAVRGAECGAKKVVLLEKTDRLGGASAQGSPIPSKNSNIQAAPRPDEPFSRLAWHWLKPPELFSRIMTESRWVANPDVVRRFVYTFATFSDWADAKKAGSAKMSAENKAAGWQGGSAIFCRLMAEYCETYGIDVYKETRANRLLTDKKGTVVGALAESADTEYKISAKSVILSTGSFSRDKEMLKKYFPQYFDNDIEFEFEGGAILGRYADGDGMKMALEIGSMPDHHMDAVVGTAHHGSESTRNIIGRPDLILVNKKGKRFMAEVLENGGFRTWLFQPDAVAFAVFDSDSLEYFQNNFSPLWGGPPRVERMLDAQRKAGERLKEENKSGTSKIADTLEEIAAYIGADPAIFKAEVERFNSFCDKGVDEDFYKDPKYLRPVRKAPFYAMRGNLFVQCTHGGIVINGNLEVMSRKGTVIKGLYATGDNASGWCSEFGWVGATSRTWALISGFMAAESSAEYLRSIG